MHRTDHVHLRRFGILAIITICAGLISCRSSHKPDSVLLISIDTLRADHLGCYGYSAGTSPAIDKIAQEGTVFERAFSAVPLTLPSHTCLLTGLYPMHTGVRDNGLFQVPDRLHLLSEVLQERGFATAAFVSGFPLNHRFGLGQGFQTYDDRPDSDSNSEFTYLERSANATVDAAIKWVETHREGRFFLFVHFFDPHIPYNIHPEFPGLSPYDSEIRVADAAVGRLIEYLGKTLDRTLIVITGDHGESLGEHGEKTHGVFIYDATLHVPLILRGEGIERGKRDARLVSLVDVFPTILSAIGIAATMNVDGVDLLKGESHPSIYAESFYPRLELGWSELRALRTAEKKFISAPTPEFYDLESDAGESRNLHSTGSPEMAGMSTELAEQIKSDTTPEPQQPDAETRQALKALGYIQGGGSTIAKNLPDPKDRILLLAIIDQATTLVDAGSPEQAAALLKPEVAREPDNPELATLYADSLEKAGLEKPLEDFFSKSARLGYPRLLIALARRCCDRGETARARDLLHTALVSGADEAQVCNEMGIAFAMDGRVKEAEDQLRRAINLDPNFRDAWTNLGHLFNQRNDCRSASDAYRRAREIGRPSSSLLNGAAVAAINCGDSQEAEQLLRSAVQLDPDSPTIKINLARLLLTEGRKKEAIDLLDGISEKLPDQMMNAVRSLRKQAAQGASEIPR